MGPREFLIYKQEIIIRGKLIIYLILIIIIQFFKFTIKKIVLI